MPSWATPSISPHAWPRGPSRARSSPPPRCSSARRPASRPRPSRSWSRARSERSPPTASAPSPVSRRQERAQELPIIGREQELAEFEAAVAAARLRQGQVAELVGEPGIGKSRLVEELKTMTRRLHAARRALRPVRDVRPLHAVSLAAPPACRNHRRGEPRRGRRSPEALDRSRHARVRALAPAARDPLRRRSADDAGDRGDRAGVPSRARLQDGRGVPAPRAGDAHAHRLRGHALDRRRLAQRPPPSRAQHRPAALDRRDHAPATGPAVRRERRRASAARACRAPGRGDGSARARGRWRGRPLRRAARRGLGALGR